MEKLRYISDSLKWIKRNKNKDDILILENSLISLFIVFDWVSSSLYAKQWTDFIKKFIWNNFLNYIIDWDFNLKKLIFDANNALLKSGLEQSYSTCSAFSYIFKKNRWKVVNLWDSRIYSIFKVFRKQLTEDDVGYKKNVITEYLWKRLNYDKIEEQIICFDNNYSWNILICTDWFYEIFEKNKLKFHRILNYEDELKVKICLMRELENKNMDDSSYIYILTRKNV
jgi:hypothetical protein